MKIETRKGKWTKGFPYLYRLIGRQIISPLRKHLSDSLIAQRDWFRDKGIKLKNLAPFIKEGKQRIVCTEP